MPVLHVLLTYILDPTCLSDVEQGMLRQYPEAISDSVIAVSKLDKRRGGSFRWREGGVIHVSVVVV